VGGLRTRGLLEGMARLGYAVVNVAERDLALGYDEFARQTKGLSIRFISTNIVRQDRREPVFEPYAILEIERASGSSPLRVGVLGVTRFSPVWLKQGPSGSTLATAPPLDMVRRFIDEVRAKSDVVVLLAAISNLDAHRIAREVPGLDFVFGAYGGVVSTVEEVEGSTRIIYTGNQGQRLGETRVYLGPAGAAVRSDSFLHHLSARYPEDESLRAFVEEVLSRAKVATSPGQEPARPAGPGTSR